MSKSTIRNVRPKFPKELRFDIHKRIGRKPESGSRQLHNAIIREDARNIVYFWSSPVYLTMTLEDQMKVYQAKTPKEADRLAKKYIRDRTGEYQWNPAVFTRNKTWINKNYAAKEGKPGEAIYGASNLGYVLGKHINMNRAARWLKSRIGQQTSECMAANHCVNIIEQQADSPEQRNVAKLLKSQASGGMQYKRLKNINSGLEAHFLQQR